MPTHTHDVEWGFVVEGAIDMTLGDTVERHAAGSTHWIRPNCPIASDFIPDGFGALLRRTPGEAERPVIDPRSRRLANLSKREVPGRPNEGNTRTVHWG